MASDALTLAELVLEYFSNRNAAGEYDGKDPRLLFETTGELDCDICIRLAYAVIQQEQMKEWNL